MRMTLTILTQAPEIITAPSQRLKGKVRKLAKQAGSGSAPLAPARPARSVTYMMSTNELVARVQAVVQSPKRPALPAGICSVLERAIAARQRCAQWYKDSGAHVEANDGHLHFIEILRNAFNALSAKDTGGGVAESAHSQVDLSNIFEALEVQEVDDEFPVIAVDVSTSSMNPSAARETYELFCFVDDLHTIQGDIQAIWRRFAKGEVDIKVANIVTQAGLDVVKRLEQEHSGRNNSCGHHGSKHPHINLAMPVFYTESYMNGEDPDEILNTVKSLEHRAFHDFLYLPTTRTLMKFADVAYKLKDQVAWPLPVFPMRFGYISRPELLELPGYKQQEDDDELLTQILHDVYLIDDSRKIARDHGMDYRGTLPILQDEFAKSARTLWETGRVSTYAVFTSRIVLDILEIYGSSDQPPFATQLKDDCMRAADTMEFVTDDLGRLDTKEVRWLTKDQQLIMDLHRRITLQIPDKAFPQFKEYFLKGYAKHPRSGPIEDMPPEFQAAYRQRMIERGEDPDDGPSEEHRRNAAKMDLEPIEPSQQHDFLQTQNALYCGSLSLQLMCLLEEAGISLANHHLSIFATAHLYNALQQLSLTEIKWPDFERIIDLHTEALFANDVPKTAADCYRRMAYRTGYSGASRTFDKKKPWKFRTGAASASLRQLVDSKDGLEHALLQLETQIDNHATQQAVRKPKKSTTTPGRRRQLNPAQIMSRFQQYLPIVLVLKDMDLNYITLTKTCNALIKAIRAALRSELGIHIPTSQAIGESNDHSVVAVVLLVLGENQSKAAVHERKKSKAAFEGSPELQVACKAFEAFFNDHAKRTIGNSS
ncbi:hypothetical protein Slin15195_G090200 [Septoria linicola]|uniref:DUF6604 domain-containing protein n=1 Tax=Septoria linicola TaxID=215465 RepID=A0A9Q9B1U9_9PEZI|nr:hypothetical protein Slin14017_G125810 [Septoria linicola]USW55701.1 hypothetical protein Slin15195_G090200 [Septoria linicola]